MKGERACRKGGGKITSRRSKKIYTREYNQKNVCVLKFIFLRVKKHFTRVLRSGSWNYHGGLALHGVLPSYARGEWPGRCDLYCDIQSVPLPCRIIPSALARAAQLRADGIFSCCYIVSVQNQPSWNHACQTEAGFRINSFLVSIALEPEFLNF